MQGSKSVAVSLILLATGASASAAVIVSPAGYATTGGSSRDPGPLRASGTGGSRSEVEYDASLFAGATGPITITSIAFRQHAGGLVENRSRAYSAAIVDLSTTANSSTDLSTTFASNITGSESTVFSGALNFTSTNTNPQPGDFEFVINFSTPFVYNPAQGNLLLDVTVPTNATVVGSGDNFSSLFDSVNVANDGEAAVGDESNGGDTAGVVETTPVTQFTFAAVPEPTSLSLLGLAVTGLVARRSRRVL